MAVSRSIQCPGETKIGWTRSFVRRAAPTVSFLSINGEREPRAGAGSSYLPQSTLLAQPHVGTSSDSPTFGAMPGRGGLFG